MTDLICGGTVFTCASISRLLAKNEQMQSDLDELRDQLTGCHQAEAAMQERVADLEAQRDHYRQILSEINKAFNRKDALQSDRETEEVEFLGLVYMAGAGAEALGQVPALTTERDELRAALEAMTPGGSEFHNDPARCLRFIRDSMASAGKVAKERNELREGCLSALRSIDKLLAALERTDPWKETDTGFECKHCGASFGGGLSRTEPHKADCPYRMAVCHVENTKSALNQPGATNQPEEGGVTD